MVSDQKCNVFCRKYYKIQDLGFYNGGYEDYCLLVCGTVGVVGIFRCLRGICFLHPQGEKFEDEGSIFRQKTNSYQTTWHHNPEDCNVQVLQQLNLISNVMNHKLICNLCSFTLYPNRETVLCLSLQVMMMWCVSLSRCMVQISFFWDMTKCP